MTKTFILTATPDGEFEMFTSLQVLPERPQDALCELRDQTDWDDMHGDGTKRVEAIGVWVEGAIHMMSRAEAGVE